MKGVAAGVVVVLGLSPVGPVAAGGADVHWPQFRGRHAAGVADGVRLPDAWDGARGTGILWKTRIPGLAHSSPVVWGEQVFVTTAISSRLDATFKPGLYGEGTQATGDFYQISNQVTLGRKEEDLIEDLVRVIPRIADYERRSRELWLKEDRLLLEDRVFRALGLLQGARKIPSEETLDLLSAVRMGAGLGIVRGVDMDRLNRLFLHCLPAHLQKCQGAEMSETERDVARARLLREVLADANG